MQDIKDVGKTIPEMMQAFYDGWLEVAEETASNDPDFDRAWQSLKDFRANYDIWRELGDMD